MRSRGLLWQQHMHPNAVSPSCLPAPDFLLKWQVVKVQLGGEGAHAAQVGRGGRPLPAHCAAVHNRARHQLERRVLVRSAAGAGRVGAKGPPRRHARHLFKHHGRGRVRAQDRQARVQAHVHVQLVGEELRQSAHKHPGDAVKVLRVRGKEGTWGTWRT